MVFGGPASDRFLLNDSTLWSGGPVDPAMNPDAITWLAEGPGGAVQGRLQGRHRADTEAAGAVLGVVYPAGRPVRRRAGAGRQGGDGVSPRTGPGDRGRADDLLRWERGLHSSGVCLSPGPGPRPPPDGVEAGRVGVRAPLREPAASRGFAGGQWRPSPLRPGSRAIRTELPPRREGTDRLRREPGRQGHAVRGEGAGPPHGRSGRARRLVARGQRRARSADRGGAGHQLRGVRQGAKPRPRSRPGHGGAARCAREEAVHDAPRSARTGLPLAVRSCGAGPGPRAEGRPPYRRPPPRLRGGRVRPGTRSALFPVRSLPPHQRLAARLASGQPAGHLEPAHAPAVEQQLHDQHQYRDELLAGRNDQPVGVPPAAAAVHRGRREDGSGHGPPLLRRRRLVRPSQQRHLGHEQPGRGLRPGQTRCGPTGRWPGPG